MKQQAFEARHSARWDRFEDFVETLEASAGAGDAAIRRRELGEFPALYLEICRDLALATERNYTLRLLDRLNRLVLAGHRLLYRRELGLAQRVLRVVSSDFPAQLRRDGRFLLVATWLFLAPGLAVATLVWLAPELIYSVMDASAVRDFESMYDPANERFGAQRPASSDLQMFGYYVFNNVGIAFRAYAGGVLCGIGSTLILVLNGIHLGAVAAHLGLLGFGGTFFPFVIGHGAFELTAIAIAGAAGLKLGFAILSPGVRTRLDALRRAAAESIVLVYGLFGMLVVASLLEAFWSSRADVAAEIKLVVGSGLWVSVLLYLLLAGRGRAQDGSPREAR